MLRAILHHCRLREPEGSRTHIGALLLAYYDDAGHLVYAGRVGTRISGAELRRLHGVLQPLRIPKMLLDVPPPRTSRFGSPLNLSRVTWVRPKVVNEVRFLTSTADGLVRQGAYQGLRADKPQRMCGDSAPPDRRHHVNR